MFWGWDDAADQVVMMVQNIRKAIVEYHDILYDLGFNTTWDEAKLKIENLYSSRPTMSNFLVWREELEMRSFDYYMENGSMQDIFRYITTPEHWCILMRMVPILLPTPMTKNQKLKKIKNGQDETTWIEEMQDANGGTN